MKGEKKRGDTAVVSARLPGHRIFATEECAAMSRSLRVATGLIVNGRKKREIERNVGKEKKEKR